VPCTIQKKAAEEKKRQTDIVDRRIQKTVRLRSEALQAMSHWDHANHRGNPAGEGCYEYVIGDSAY